MFLLTKSANQANQSFGRSELANLLHPVFGSFNCENADPQQKDREIHYSSIIRDSFKEADDNNW